MSTAPKTEAQELRELLQGAIADRDEARRLLEATRRELARTQQDLEYMTGERNKLLAEKRLIWDRALQEES